MPSKMKTCEDYRTSLIDAAASAVQPLSELRSHLDACASCRTTFAGETQLFAAIDCGVRAVANAEVPTSLLPRVRAELNDRTVPRRSWVPAGAAFAAAATLVLVIVFFRGAGRGIVEPSPQMSSAVQSALPAEIRPGTTAVMPSETIGRPAKNKPIRPIKTALRAKREDVAVLIPGVQKQAIDALLASVQHGKFDGEVLLAEKPEKALEELHFAPLDISPIEMKPLADVSPESQGSQNEKTRH